MLRRSVCFALLTCAVFAHADDVKTTIQKRYDAFNKAMTKNDFATMEKWLKANCTTDFKYTSHDKNKYPLKQFIDGLKDQTRATKKVETSTFKVNSSTIEGAKATFTTSSSFKGLISFQGQTLTLTDKSDTTDVWVKVGSDWKLKSMTQTKSDTQMFQK